MTPDDERIATAITRLLAQRPTDATICPSEVARALAEDEASWRALMPEIRRVAADLANAGDLRVTARGQVVDATKAGGPIRLGRVSPDRSA